MVGLYFSFVAVIRPLRAVISYGYFILRSAGIVTYNIYFKLVVSQFAAAFFKYLAGVLSLIAFAVVLIFIFFPFPPFGFPVCVGCIPLTLIIIKENLK